MKSKLPRSNSPPVLRAGEEQGRELPKIRGHNKSLACIPAVHGWHRIFIFLNLSQDLKVSVELTKKSRLVASHKNMVTSGSTVLINIHAQPQS